MVLQFIVDHAQRSTADGLVHELPPAIDEVLVQAGFKGKLGPMALNTLVHRIAVLSKTHQIKELKNPCQDAKVRELLGKTRRAYGKRGDLPKKKDAQLTTKWHACYVKRCTHQDRPCSLASAEGRPLKC